MALWVEFFSGEFWNGEFESDTDEESMNCLLNEDIVST